MAVSEVKLLAAGALGGADGADASNEKVAYSLTYQVKCDSQLDGPVTVMNYFRTHAEYPWLGRTFKFGNDFDTSALCRSVRPAYIENSGGIFVVPCEFSSAGSDDNGTGGKTDKGKPEKDPKKWHAEISVSFGTYSAPVESATLIGALNATKLSPHLKVGSFLPITNSKLEPLDPTFEEEYALKIIRITRNVAGYDDEFYNKYHDTINDADVTIEMPEYDFRATIGKHYGRLRVSTDFQMTDDGIGYYRQTLEYAIKGWNRAILDQTHVYSEILRDGDTKRDGTTIVTADIPAGFLQVEVPIKDDDGLSPSRPMLLNGDGKQLKEGNPPVSLVWQSVPEADHTALWNE